MPVGFVPCNKEWRRAAWIEIDRKKNCVGIRFRLRASGQMESGESVSARDYAIIESAHLGPIPRAAFKKGFPCQRRR